MNYIIGPDRAPILPDGTIKFYREILTPDGQELIGREYPSEAYCWVNLTRLALNAGFTHDDLWEAQQAAREVYFNSAYPEARRAELAGLRQQVCSACAEGDHEQIRLAPCACPCHGATNA